MIHTISNFCLFSIRNWILFPSQTLVVATCAKISPTSCVFDISFADYKDFLYVKPNYRYTQMQTKGKLDQLTFRINDVKVKKIVIG